eukprot:scaffold7470_cov84-Skeletonema_dohrnii-CCMP3373.AAC.2
MVLERGDVERLMYFAMRSMTMIAGKFLDDDTRRKVKNIFKLIGERRCSLLYAYIDWGGHGTRTRFIIIIIRLRSPCPCHLEQSDSKTTAHSPKHLPALFSFGAFLFLTTTLCTHSSC